MKGLAAPRGGRAARIAIVAALTLGLGFFAGDGLQAAQNAAGVPGVPVHMTVTVIAKHGGQVPALQMNDIAVATEREHAPIVSWVPAQGPNAGLQLLVLIDNSSRSILGSQLGDLRNFILQQPASTSVGVGYMYNGLVHMDQDYTTDHNAAAKALRPPVGSPGAASPYFSLMDYLKHWKPDPAYPRHEVLMIANGDDPYQGHQIEDPYVEEAISDVQRAGLQVFAIYTPGTTGGSYWGGTYLSMLSKGTGGLPLYLGPGSAVSFAPFLNNLTYMLYHQYLLTFTVRQPKKADLVKVKVSTGVDNAELHAPENVWVPGVED